MMDPIWVKQYGTMPPHLSYERTSLYEQLRKSAYKYRNRLAMDCYGNRLRYSKLLTLTDTLANTLETVGVKAGGRVCLLLPGGMYATALLYAANRIGAIVTLLPEDCTKAQIEAVFSGTEFAAVILSELYYEKFMGLWKKNMLRGLIVHRLWQEAPRAKRLSVKKKILYREKIGHDGKAPLYLDELASHHDYACPSAPFDWQTTRQTALELYTQNENGGLTPLLFTNFALTLSATQFAAELTEYGQEQGLVMPLPFASMLSVTVSHAALTGGMTRIVDPYIEDFCDSIYQAFPETVLATPSDWKQWIDAGHDDKETMFFFKNIFIVCDSNISVQNDLQQLFAAHECTAAVRNCYSLNETAGAVIMTPPAPQQPDALGVPVSDVYAKICGDDGLTPLAAGQTGEIVVATPAMMQNQMSSVLRDAYGNRWFATGDIGQMSADGTIRLVGRKKKICKVNGKTVFIKRTEVALRRTGQVADVQCEPIENAQSGQRLKVFLQPITPPQDSKEFAGILLREIKKILPPENLPVEIAVVKTLYRRPDGSVDIEHLKAEKRKQSPFTL